MSWRPIHGIDVRGKEVERYDGRVLGSNAPVPHDSARLKISKVGYFLDAAGRDLHAANRATLVVGLVVNILPVFGPDRIVEGSASKLGPLLRRDIEEHQLALVEGHRDEIAAIG